MPSYQDVTHGPPGEITEAQKEAGRTAMQVYAKLLAAQRWRTMLNAGVWPVLTRMRRAPYDRLGTKALSCGTAYVGLIAPTEQLRPLWAIGADIERVERLDPPWRFEPVQDMTRPAAPGWVLEHRYEAGTREWTEGVAPEPAAVPTSGRPGKTAYVVGAEFAGRAGPNRRIVGAPRPDGMLSYVQVDVGGAVLSESRHVSSETFRKWVRHKL